MRVSHKLFTVASPIALLSGAPALAQAADQLAGGSADESGATQEIVVTAQRREQSLLKVPLAISVVGNETLQSKGISASSELASAVPNLQVSSPFSIIPNFTMRGVGVGNEYNANQASPVGVYIDDAYVASRASQGLQIFDLDRVEVLRGPQGTLYGRNTTGGAINFITRSPKLSGNNGFVELGYGNADDRQAQAAVEVTLVEDQMGIRVAGTYEKNDGLIRNVVPGTPKPNSTDSLSGRVTLRIKPGDGAVDIRLKAFAARSDGTQVGVHGITAARAGLGFFETAHGIVSKQPMRAQGGQANVKINVSDRVTLTSVTSLQSGKSFVVQEADGAPAAVLYDDLRSKTREFNQELRLNYDMDGLHLVGGAYYGSDRNKTNNLFNIGGTTGFVQSFVQHRKSYAAFAQGDFNITSDLVLTAGIRYTRDKSRYEDGKAFFVVLPFEAGPVTQVLQTVSGSDLPVSRRCVTKPDNSVNLCDSESAVTGKIGLSYTLSDGTLLFASASKGYRSGAVNGGGFTSARGIFYVAPEKVNAFEAGFKGRYFDNALTASVSAFYYDYTNQQLQDLRQENTIVGPAPVSFLLNAPKSEIYGLEGEFQLRASSSLTLNASIGYLHATYKQLELGTLLDANSVPIPGSGTRLDGNDLTQAPRWSLQAGFDWQAFEAAGGDVRLNGNVNYYSRQWLSPWNSSNGVGTGSRNQELVQPGYAKVNGEISWEKGNVRISFWAKNLFNEKTYAYGLDLYSGGLGYNYLAVANPRTYGGKVRLSF